MQPGSSEARSGGDQSGRWSVGGFAADPPTLAGALADDSNDQLVQAMAGFGGGSGAFDGSSVGVPHADATQQTLLTTPQHA
jgi:hypothetical protein